MIVINIDQMIQAMPVFQNIVNLPMPASLGFKVAKIASQLNEQFQIFIQYRDKLFNDFVEKDENGEFKRNSDNTFVVNEENRAAYQEEIENLLKENIEILGTKFTIDDLEHFELTPNDIMKIQFFIEE